MAALTTKSIVNVNLFVGYSATAASAFEAGIILGSSDVITVTDRVKEYSGISEVAEEFASTTPEYQAALLYFSQNPSPNSVYIGRIGESEAPADALDACFGKIGSVWGVYMCGATKENIVALDAYLSASGMGMLFTSVSTQTAAVDTDGAFAALSASKTRRSFGIVATETHAGAAVMGLVIGMGANTANAFALCYKSITGVSPVSMTTAQINAVKALNANVYVTRGFVYNLIEQGSTFHGLRVDEVFYLDRMTADIQDAVMTIMTNEYGKLPQTDEGSTTVLSAIKGVLNEYVDIGFLGAGVWRGAEINGIASGETMDAGYAVEVDSYANQTQADREAHKAMPFRVGVTLAGSVESVEINVYAQV